MTSLIKKNLIGGFHWIKAGLILSGALLSAGQTHAEERMKTNYTLSFNANNALCFVKINDMLVMDNDGMWEGQFTMGRTVSSYLKNGENTLSIAMLNESVNDDDMCSAKIQDVRSDGSNEYVAAVKLIVRDGQITPDTMYYSGRYASFGDSPRVKNTEEGFREVAQIFHATDLPDWPWITATPVTEKDTPAIKSFYESLQNDFKRQDLPAIYRQTKGMWESLATEQGSTSQQMWDSMDYKDFFDGGYKAVPIDWDGFTLNSYMDGRVFRFEKGYGRVSPLKIKNKADKVFITTPYLSIINGQVTVVK